MWRTPAVAPQASEQPVIVHATDQLVKFGC
jgi:hypothetical protein